MLEATRSLLALKLASPAYSGMWTWLLAPWGSTQCGIPPVGRVGSPKRVMNLLLIEAFPVPTTGRISSTELRSCFAFQSVAKVSVHSLSG